MTLDLITPTRPRADRRRLAEQDRASAHRAELHHIQALVADARAVVGSGWVQHAWFSYRDEQARQHTATARTLDRMAGRPVTGACLVGAVLHAGGGLAAVPTQPVQRAFDLIWHTLYRGALEPVRWCPAPSVRTAHIRDLTRWNDHAGRSADDVTALLRSAELAAGQELALLRS